MLPLLALAVVPLVAATPLRLLHRIYDPTVPDALFHDRAVLTPDAAGLFSVEPSPSADTLFAQTAHDVSHALYQLALAPTADADPDAPWLISSVRACHLSHLPAEHIVLHLPAPGSPPTALDYFLVPVPDDGACPPHTPALAAPRNLSVSVALPTHPPLPDLRVPPPVTTEGDPAEPVVEKSFIQKYWLYIVLALGAMLLAPGPDDSAAAGS
ncbi:hypothetical protein FA95DRAFT_1607819 [Auriscalpium vulgare]|uniref:Uncharacterized protein n=1 Tax=Auriscalpium vulgare TaxID=40419 RepID=A0ACB8RMH5_9AGAM|nr:hypothetical protein FA95DRAFT_1607819 [Auriscalpium vulgare]